MIYYHTYHTCISFFAVYAVFGAKNPNLQQFFAALAKNFGACVAQHEFVMAKASLRGWLLNKAVVRLGVGWERQDR